MRRVDVVALIIHDNGKVLVEKRKKDRKVDPDKVAIPGGHIEKEESFEQACRRELQEELDLECDNFRFITRMPHDAFSEKQMVHYYSCENWKGVPKSREAERIFWTGVKDLSRLDFQIDRKAIQKFLEQAR